MIRKIFESIVSRSKSDEGEIVEEGFFVFEDPNGKDSIMTSYKLKEGEDFERERNKVAAIVFSKEREVN